MKNCPSKANLARVANYKFKINKANFATKTKHEAKLNFATLICLVIPNTLCVTLINFVILSERSIHIKNGERITADCVQWSTAD